MIRISAVHVNASACTSASSWMWPRICGIAISRLEEEQDDGGDRAREPGQQPFEHERPAHVPVRRADELHHLDLASAGMHREPDRVRDEDRRGREQHEDRDEEDDLDRARDRRGCAARPPCRSAPRRRRRASTFWTPIAIASVSSPRIGTTSNEAGSGFEARFAVSSGIALAHDLERLRLRDEGDAARLHALVGLEQDAQLVDVLRRRPVGDEDVDRELALLVVRPRDEPRAEADEDADAGTSR